MKLAPLFIEFFYANRRLDLPGIGSFLLDDAIHADTADIKSGKLVISEGIRFQPNTSLKDSPELVSFIASATGKIRALAAADLDSNLETARQFLNIGKPFMFEGIGSLVKTADGSFSFSAGAPALERAGYKTSGDDPDHGYTSEKQDSFKSIFYAQKGKPNYRKAVFILLLVGGVGLAIWGGYSVYKRSTGGNNHKTVNAGLADTGNNTEEHPVAHQADSIPVAKSPAIDSDLVKNVTPGNVIKTPAAPVPLGNLKFVVETADKVRGLSRYNRLKGFGLDIRMETIDSQLFKLYFILPASATDSSRILDSLRWLYTPPGRMAYIDK